MKEEKLKNNKSYILFVDGVCSLCNNLVNFVYKKNKSRNIKFSSLDSNKYLELKIRGSFDSVVVYSIEDRNYYTKSSAIKIVLSNLTLSYRILSLFFNIIPLRLKDLIYDWIAKNRYKIFGKQSTCLIPTKELQSRFL